MGDDEPEGELQQAEPGLLRHDLELLHRVELALGDRLVAVIEVRGVARRARVRRGRLAAPVLAREPAAVERAEHKHADAVALCRRQHRGLGLPGKDRIGQLLGGEALSPSPLRDPLCLDELLRRKRGGADRANLALVDQVGQRSERLVDVGVGVGSMRLIQVDVVGPEPAQAVLDGGHDPAPRVPQCVQAGAHLVVELGGEHHVVAPPLQSAADDLFAAAERVLVGGVDEVDSRRRVRRCTIR